MADDEATKTQGGGSAGSGGSEDVAGTGEPVVKPRRRRRRRRVQPSGGVLSSANTEQSGATAPAPDFASPPAAAPVPPVAPALEPALASSPVPTPVPPVEPERPAPTPYDYSAEPSPFDLAASYDGGGASADPGYEGDSFADYQSPFGPSPSAPVEPASPSAPVAPAPALAKPAPALKPSPYDYFAAPESVAPEPEPEPFDAKMADTPLEGELVEPPSPPSVAADHAAAHEPDTIQGMGLNGSLRERFEELLHEANLTTRHLKFCCGGLLAVGALVVAGFFLVPRLFDGTENAPSPAEDMPVTEDDASSPSEEGADITDTPVVEDTPVSTDTSWPEVSEAPPSIPTKPVWVDSSVYAGLRLGEPLQRFEESGTTSGVFIGSEAEFDARESILREEAEVNRLVVFLEDLEGLYNLHTLDLNGLLDASSNRTEALDTYLRTLTDHYNGSVTLFEEVQIIKEEFLRIFNEGVPVKDALELEFFNEVRAYHGPDTIASLKRFVEESQRLIDLRAKYFAFVKIQSLYEWILPPFKRRVEDIKLNRDALIAGVRVVDLDGSDLGLVVGKEDLGPLEPEVVNIPR